MPNIKILETFGAGPRGKTEFKAGETLSEKDLADRGFSAEDAQLFVDKGHAVVVSADAPQRRKGGEK